MPRTILVHLNVEIPDDDPRTAEDIATYLNASLALGLVSHDGGEGIAIAIPLAEEI